VSADRGPVLIVDDDADIVDFLTMMLQFEGIATRSASSAEEAERVLREPGAAALVLCDITMPDRDGLDFCRALRAAPHTRETPVFILSGRVENEIEALARAAGANQFFRKPFDHGELVARIRDELGK